MQYTALAELSNSTTPQSPMSDRAKILVSVVLLWLQLYVTRDDLSPICLYPEGKAERETEREAFRRISRSVSILIP